MAFDWQAHKAHRRAIVDAQGYYLCILDRDWTPVLDITDIISADLAEAAGDTANLSLTLPGWLPTDSGDQVANPATDYLLAGGVTDFDDTGALDQLFNEAVHILAEVPAADGQVARRVYRVTGLDPEGGRLYPDTVGVSGVDMIEYLKHIPLWPDPSNRSKVVQLQFSDRQKGSVEVVSRKLILRNLLGYFQPSLLGTSLGWTEDWWSTKKWAGVNPEYHPIMCSPIASGLESEYCVIEARWDNAWDLLRPSWEAGGVMPTVDLWIPGDPQPFPKHTTLVKPTAIIDFKPRSTVDGAVGLIGQAWRSLKRTIGSDSFSSATEFSDVPIPTADGRDPWVVYDFEDAPKVSIRKSTDHTFVVGGKSPKIVNEVVAAGVKTAVAALVAAIPVIGPPAAEAIKGGAEIVAKLTADRFLNINQFTDQQRKAWHGRSGYVALMKTGEANTSEALQKGWQAKTETAGGISIEFDVESWDPYLPHRDFEVGDTIGITAWGRVWAAYVSEITWTINPGEGLAYTIRLGSLDALKDPEALFAQNLEAIEQFASRISTAVTQ